MSSLRDSPISSHFTRHFRAGLSYPAATRLESWQCLLDRMRSIVLTHTLQVAPFQTVYKLQFPEAVKLCPTHNIYESVPNTFIDSASKHIY